MSSFPPSVHDAETQGPPSRKSVWSRLIGGVRECFVSSKSRTPYREILVNPWQPKELLQQEGKDRRLNFPNNAVITAKYNAVTFVPRAVLEQFRRMANLYFLLISSMMFIGSYTYIFDSPLTPWSTLVPLLVVLAITIGKEGAEDLKRHEADKQTNNRLVERLRDRIPGEVLAHCGVAGTTNMFHKVTWKELVPGDIIKVHNKENIPADIIVLLTSEQGGACYIETSNIDGETNLKIKRCAHTESVGSAWKAPNQLVGEEMLIRCEHPNSMIHHFNGSLLWRERLYPLDASNLLLRGSTLQNTSWVVGMVVYSGKDTKIVMNSRSAPSKMSSIEAIINQLVFVIFSAQVLIATISLICFIIWESYYKEQLSYLCFGPTQEERGCRTEEKEYKDAAYWFTFFILYCNFLPISLYVTVELCNYIQAYYIDNDLEMYDQHTNTAALARTSNMNGDLGMVEYVFSDKTGTLTQNKMLFCRCAIAGEVFGGPPAANTATAPGARVGSESYDDHDAPPPQPPEAGAVPYKPVAMIRELSRLPRVAGNDGEGTNNAELETTAFELVMSMAVAHTVVVTDDSESRRILQAESPDEKALVKAATRLGWEFIGRRDQFVQIRRNTTGRSSLNDARAGVSDARDSIGTSPILSPTDAAQVLEYELLATIPFDSNRKRMSVIVKTPDGRYLVLCKGADTVIMKRAARYINSSVETMNKHLGIFATDGLRTLLFAKRELSKKEYDSFKVAWDAANSSINERVTLTAKAAEMVEADLIVLGCTAIEDKLQDGVPETIANIGKAGVKLWVLTGDKIETAVNLGYSSGMIGPEMVLIRLHSGVDGSAKLDSKAEVQTKLRAILNHFKRLLVVAVRTDPALDSLGDSRGSFSITTSQSAATTSPRRGVVEPILQPMDNAPDLHNLTTEHLALIVDGDFLLHILGNPEMEQYFIPLARICKCVIACRVSPEQKRLMVRLVKKGVKPRPITLAIGDGANDVAMLQEAQIGVGISGKEGMQAVNASDFAIAQFKFLGRLMLIHGRRDYSRVCHVVLYSFYKNVVLTIVLFLFTFYSAFSGESLFDDYLYSSYNFILALPVVALGVFDRDISDHSLNKFPVLYATGRERSEMSGVVLLKQIIQAVIDAVLIFFIPFGSYLATGDISHPNGTNTGIWVFGTTVFTCLVLSMFARCAIITFSWTLPSVLFMWGSIGLYFAFIFTYQYVDVVYNFKHIANQMSSMPTFWFIVLLVPTLTVTLELGLRMLQKEFAPTLVDYGVEYDRLYVADRDRELAEKGAGKFVRMSSISGSDHEPLMLGSGSDKHAPSGVAAPGDIELVRTASGSAHGSTSPLPFAAAVTSGSGATAPTEETAVSSAQASLAHLAARLGKPKYALDWTSIRHLHNSLSNRERKGFGMLNTTDDPVGSSYSYDHVTSDYGPGAGADNDAEVAEMASALASAPQHGGEAMSNGSSSPLLSEALDNSGSNAGELEHAESMALDHRIGIARIMPSSRAGYSPLLTSSSSPSIVSATAGAGILAAVRQDPSTAVSSAAPDEGAVNGQSLLLGASNPRSS